MYGVVQMRCQDAGGIHSPGPRPEEETGESALTRRRRCLLLRAGVPGPLRWTRWLLRRGHTVVEPRPLGPLSRLFRRGQRRERCRKRRRS